MTQSRTVPKHVDRGRPFVDVVQFVANIDTVLKPDRGDQDWA